ncbi:ABC-type nitrate/sulfonate/bicarbonate transport system, substrate-binding protein [Sinosporangium album]|uniref:ABC-type nitrate/sulfonate/bicarbonate transport system, substrate-binding protein n=1 Tax=Sinosporangium album TaxID=504805 RepID=A0A1G7T5K2_9ACTN|nr:ABC transporter substrate-binding protein [Sinosporangium album]SDG30372.1 ABC-type nitrate/sulfonate/bicarbonate transport system, substrate-binding protein [Sinosporangium album]
MQELWFTRCPVPTATGVAADLGWFDEEFGPDGIAVRSLQDGPDPRGRHFTHELTALVREGGNVPALWARARGRTTRLIGLTWIEERQAVLTTPTSPIRDAEGLRGRRLGLPVRTDAPVDFWRAMALRGFHGALSIAGLTLSDARLVDVPSGPDPDPGHWAPELDALARGAIDAVYVKGSRAVEDAERHGLRVAVDLDAHPDRAVRVNNGTPRPITVDQALLDTRPDVVARFLKVLLDAAAYAADHPERTALILGRETGAGARGVAGAYGTPDLSIDLSDERLALLADQERFLREHGFLDSAVDVAAWADHTPLLGARTRRRTTVEQSA